MHGGVPRRAQGLFAPRYRSRWGSLETSGAQRAPERRASSRRTMRLHGGIGGPPDVDLGALIEALTALRPRTQEIEAAIAAHLGFTWQSTAAEAVSQPMSEQPRELEVLPKLPPPMPRSSQREGRRPEELQPMA